MVDSFEMIRWVAAWPLGAIGMAKTMGELPIVRGLGDMASARRPDIAPLDLSAAFKMGDEGAIM
jgi:hypothetical protein